MKRLIVWSAVLFLLAACSPKVTPMGLPAASEAVATATSAPASTGTFTPAPSATPTRTLTATRKPSPTRTPTATPLGGAGRLLIGYGEMQEGRMSGKGIYLLDLESRRREALLAGDYLLQALGSDHDRLLVSTGTRLYTYRISAGGEPALLTDLFDPRTRHMETLAYWPDTENVVFASAETIYLANLKQNTTQALAEGFHALPELFPYEGTAGVYWQDITRPGLRYSSLDGSRQESLNRFAPACITGRGNKMAYNGPMGYQFMAAGLDGSNARQLFGPESPVYRLRRLWEEGGGVYVCSWSNDGEQVLLSLNTQRAAPWEGEYRHFILKADGTLLREIPAELVGKEWLVSAWSPDDRRILFYYLNHGLSVLDIASFEVQDYSLELGITPSNAIDRVYWLPSP